MFEDWYSDPVGVRRLTNEDPTSDAQSWAARTALMGMVREDVTLTRDATGAEVTSTVTVHLPLSAAGKVNAGALIDLPESQHPDTVAISVMVSRGDPDLKGVRVMCQ
ncbi:hypothetical protein FDO65_10095 [Nakamurella flava]|uniref:Uncharacterized protein n=1 Tax=Nakamurella flava TaxID=2576308 RepID=A0A4V6CU58_9ACTN|nr:hypothetical protein [Nakamurella flava]TKV61865.1 hypothetical protein FDO65_10095 [Nakamurella flava]